MKKKLFMVTLVAVIAVNLTACGKDNGRSKERAWDDVEIGDYITFGSYEQDGDNSNGAEDIQWLVLDKQDDRILVISRYILDYLRFNQSSRSDFTWETCTLRNWLNNDFYEMAFSSKEQKRIVEVKNMNESSEWYFKTPYFKSKGWDGTYSIGDTVFELDYADAGNPTYDKVFLLSVEEVFSCYMTSESDRICEETEYSKSKNFNNVTREWALRSPGIVNNSCCLVDRESGFISGSFFMACYGVRPAMWLSVE